MKGLYYKIGAVIVLMTSVIMLTANSVEASSASEQYKMIWSDEFSGNSLNTNNWNYDIGNGGANVGWGNNEHEYYTDRTDNVKVQNGALIITAKAEEYLPEGMNNPYSYTSGRLNSSGKQSFKYGKMEARIKVPAVRGLWPAFWMLGQNEPKGWPYCGEIDILETWNEMHFAQGTIHWENELEKPNRDSYDASSTKMADKTQWHLYGINWTPKKIEWTLDNKVYKTFELKGSDKSELKKEFYFIINCAVGGNLAYFLPNQDFTSSTMMVDYVRVYQRACDKGSFTGKWTEKGKVATHDILYKNGGKVISRQKLLDGETSIVPTVTKKGYKFLGWYNGKKKVTKNTRIYTNATISAKWEKIKVKQAKITSTKQKYKKYATVKFKVKGKADGYQVKIGKKKEFTESKIITMGKYKSGKKYKVRVRAYRIDSRGKKIYGKWSKSAKITIK